LVGVDIYGVGTVFLDIIYINFRLHLVNNV